MAFQGPCVLTAHPCYSRPGLVGRPFQLKGTLVSSASRRVPSHTPMARWPSEGPCVISRVLSNQGR
eukprot:8884019-Pyramimonas_sp.AAC.1